MNQQALADLLAQLLAASPGVRGCAVVDADSGFIWHRCGPDTSHLNDPLWEAAAEYWRLHRRLRPHFTELGDLGAAVLYHHQAVLAVLPCQRDPDVLVICRAEHSKVDWRAWQRGISSLGHRLSTFLTSPSENHGHDSTNPG